MAVTLVRELAALRAHASRLVGELRPDELDTATAAEVVGLFADVEKLLTVKAMFGHENFSTTERYTTLLGVLEAIRANRDAINRAQEADEIDRATFLARQRHTEKRGHKR